MMGPLLETKLHRPRPRTGLVARPRLSDRLGRAGRTSLTLVSAPAGFGKTTLLTEWLAETTAVGQRVAWLSLDARDNEPEVFWTYVVTALQGVEPAVGAEALTLLRPPQAPIDAVLGALLNDLSGVSGEVVLVLDDFHVIDAPELSEGMAFLLEHLPAQIRLVIASRTDPNLPLPRLRARGELLEIRGADLRFTPDEAADYLTGAMGLSLTADDVAALEDRTEGWIAALQLAALSMQGRDDAAEFIAGFTGDDRYIVDYLAEEVLQRQPEPVRAFLLQTSILDRLTGPLCDAVTGQVGGKARLAALDRDNLFLVPLDDRRQWYRYHQLFADVLQAHLLDEQPDHVAELHRRASTWFSDATDPSDAIRHSLAAGDFERAAELVERAIPDLRRTRREATARAWLGALPDAVVRVRPVLNVGLAGALLSVGEIDGVEDRLQETERQLATTSGLSDARSASTGTSGPGNDELLRVPAMIELYRAALALAKGDGDSTVTHALLARDRAAQDDDLCRAAAAGLLGIAYWGRGDLDAAHASYSECVVGLHRAGHTADTLGCAVALGDIRRTQGRLTDAMLTYERALDAAQGPLGAPLRGTSDMYVGMSEILRERDDLEPATEWLERSQDLGDWNGLPQNRYRWRVAMSRVRESEGDLDAAADLLREAERLYVSDFFPPVRPVAAMLARTQVVQGDLAAARAWVRDRGLRVDDDLDYLTEFEHITLARILLAQRSSAPGEPDSDTLPDLLERLLDAADDGGRTGSVIEILVLQALESQSRQDLPAAISALARALALGEPQGYVRVFVDEGPPMATLLRALEPSAASPRYVTQLLHALTPEDHRPAPTQRLVEPLSERELQVLRLLGTDLDGPAIARHLVVSLSTVRTHTKNIYTKLGVNNRRAAVRRGDELGLTAHPGHTGSSST